MVKKRGLGARRACVLGLLGDWGLDIARMKKTSIVDRIGAVGVLKR